MVNPRDIAGERKKKKKKKKKDPRQVLYKPSLLGAKNEKTKRILMCEVTVFCVQ